MAHIEGSSLSEEDLRRIRSRLPKKYRDEGKRVLAEIVPPERARALSSYVAVWELRDGRWLIVDVMLGGMRNASQVQVKDHVVLPGHTKARETVITSKVLVGTPEYVLDPMHMPRSIALRLWRKLSENLRTLDGGTYEKYAAAAQPTKRYAKAGAETPGSTDEERAREGIAGVEPPTRKEIEKLIGLHPENNPLYPGSAASTHKADEGKDTTKRRERGIE